MASKMLKFWLGLFLVGIYGLPAQNLRMDSLQKLLKKLPDGKEKVEAINELAFDYIFYSYDTSMKYANEAEDLAVRVGYPVGKALSLNISGIVYRIQGNYSRALDSHLQSLRICEQENYPQGIANNFSNIGLVYYDKEDYKKALEYFEKALKIKEEIKDLRGVAFSLNDIGGVYLRLGNLEKAQATYLKSIQVREKIGDQQGLATSLNNLGRLYLEKGELEKALNYLKRSIKVGRSFNDQLSIAITLNNIAEVYFKQGDFEKAKQSHQQALQVARSINSKIEIRNAYLGLARCHQQLEEYAPAFDYLETYVALKDSLSNEENNKRVASLEYGYKLEIKDIELKRQSLIRNALIGGAILIIVALLFIIRAIRQKRGAYQLLKAQKTEIEQQRDNMAAQKQALEQAYQEITRQNQQITSSVAYARNIQRALLPDQELKAYFDKYYIINRPQYDVSGDFYWFRELKGKHFLAIADCTGKGVAGAFMSTISINLLDEIVNIKQIEDPALILAAFDQEFRAALRQDQQRNEDRVEMALCCIEDLPENPNYKRITYCGARIPLRYSQGWEVREIAPDPHAIGGGSQEGSKSFKNHSFDLKKFDHLYLFTDGLLNQPDAEQNPFGNERLKEILQHSLAQPMEKQKQILEAEIETLLQNSKQKDDMTAVVVRLATH